MPDRLLCARAEEQNTFGENLDELAKQTVNENLHGEKGVSPEIFGSNYFLN